MKLINSNGAKHKPQGTPRGTLIKSDSWREASADRNPSLESNSRSKSPRSTISRRGTVSVEGTIFPSRQALRRYAFGQGGRSAMLSRKCGLWNSEARYYSTARYFFFSGTRENPGTWIRGNAIMRGGKTERTAGVKFARETPREAKSDPPRSLLFKFLPLA